MKRPKVLGWRYGYTWIYIRLWLTLIIEKLTLPIGGLFFYLFNNERPFAVGYFLSNSVYGTFAMFVSIVGMFVVAIKFVKATSRKQLKEQDSSKRYYDYYSDSMSGVYTMNVVHNFHSIYYAIDGKGSYFKYGADGVILQWLKIISVYLIAFGFMVTGFTIWFWVVVTILIINIPTLSLLRESLNDDFKFYFNLKDFNYRKEGIKRYLNQWTAKMTKYNLKHTVKGHYNYSSGSYERNKTFYGAVIEFHMKGFPKKFRRIRVRYGMNNCGLDWTYNNGPAYYIGEVEPIRYIISDY